MAWGAPEPEKYGPPEDRRAKGRLAQFIWVNASA